MAERTTSQKGYYEQRDTLWGILIEKTAGSFSLWAGYPGYRGATGRKLDTPEGFHIFAKLKFLFFSEEQVLHPKGFSSDTII